MTPHELNLSIEAFSERREKELEEKIDLAKYTSYLISAWDPFRTRRLPNWNEVFGKQTKKEQTPEQMLAQIKALTIKFGGEIREGG